MEPIVEFKNITMEFPGVRANDDVSLSICKGEIFALVGENGAGKSTLMNVLYGILTPTKGEMFVKGQKITEFSPKNAISLGVGMVHQHFMLVPSFTVAQNIVLSREPQKHGILYDLDAANKAVADLSEEYGLEVTPTDVVGQLSVGLQQRVEILKTLYRGAEVLILDEPTAVLTPQETDELFAVLRRVVREKDMTVIIITHKLYEVMAISDRVGVMRQGKLIGIEETKNVNERILASMMVGREVLQDPVDKYFPEFRELPMVAEKDGELVKVGKPERLPTVLHLLTHTSGFGGVVEGIQQRQIDSESNATLQNAVRYFSKAGIGFEPFTNVMYSGRAAFDVLTGIIERITDTPYDQYVKENILDPCGMVDTTFAPTKEQWERMIPMHDRVDGKACVGRTVDGCVFENVPVTHFAGGAGLASTLEDYTHFARMLLNGGEFAGNRILKPETVALMATPHVPESLMPAPKRWGLSMKVVTREDYGRLPVGCFGWSGAYGTHYWVDPVNKIVAVYMKNSRYDGGSGALTGKHFEEDVFSSIL